MMKAISSVTFATFSDFDRTVLYTMLVEVFVIIVRSVTDLVIHFHREIFRLNVLLATYSY